MIKYPHRNTSNKLYTYTSRPFAGVIVEKDKENEGQKYKVKDYKLLHPRWYHHELGKFKVGERVTVVITNKKPKRTENQNRYLWGAYYPLVSRETGEQDINALHELFKGKFLTEKIRYVLGEPVRIKRSTTELSVGEFCEFIANIYQLTGVEPPPTEGYDISPLRKE